MNLTSISTLAVGCLLVLSAQAQSHLDLVLVPSPAGPVPTLTLAGALGRYELQRTDILGDATNWLVVTNLTLSNTPVRVAEGPAGTASQRFYRARWVAPLETGFPEPSQWAWIPQGTFTMGSPTNEPVRSPDETQMTVTLTRGFYMARYETTQGHYEALMGANPSYFTGDTNRPVERVTWSDATNYCGRLTLLEQAAGRLPTGWEYRLPTEAEWEYACRAGTATAFHCGPALDPTLADFDPHWEYDATVGEIYVATPTNNPNGTVAVGSYPPNPWGLYDMHGNVWEWCQDWYGDYPGGSVTDPTGPAGGLYRVCRGGDARHRAVNARSASRWSSQYIARATYVGLRLVLAPTQP